MSAFAVMTAENEQQQQPANLDFSCDSCSEVAPGTLKFPEPLQAKDVQSMRAYSSGTNNSNNSSENHDPAQQPQRITYAGQGQLPRLPIPTLEETLGKFPKVLAALLDDEKDKEEMRREIESFLQGDGPILQKALVEYEQTGVESGMLGSYVEEFWNDSYLSPDASVVLNLNPYFVLEKGPNPTIATNQLRRAARLCFASVKLASLLRQEKLSPDVFRGKPLCMDQFKVLLGASRQPGIHQDDANHDHADDIHVYKDSSHVVVLCNNQFYYFPVLWPESGNVAVDETDILDVLEAIQQHAQQTDSLETSRNAIGVLTSLQRSQWAAARHLLSQNHVNQTALHVIDSALFVLVLDDYTPSNIHAAAANMLHGTNTLREISGNDNDGGDRGADGDSQFIQVGSCLNRWYDKLQLIVCKDGTAGVNFEHAAIDGHTALRFVSDVFAETIILFAESITQLIHGRGRVPHVLDAVITRAADCRDGQGKPRLDVYPKKLVFELSDEDRTRIFYAETALCDQIISNETIVLEFQDYGKSFIVGNKISPDAFVQLSFILAYYKLYGRIVCTYEPVLTKSFYHGRTEAMRSATLQAKELCEIWCLRLSTPEEKLAALKTAAEEHARLVQESARGKGVDRHLFALKCMADRMKLPTPAFFQGKAWNTLNHTILSTSNCGNPSLRLFGFGPVVQNGFGIGYIIKDNGLSFSVASKHRQTQRFVNTLERTLHEMKTVLKPLTKMQVTTRKSTNEVSVPVQLHSAYDDIYGESAIFVNAAATTETIAAAAAAAVKPVSKVFFNVKEKLASKNPHHHVRSLSEGPVFSSKNDGDQGQQHHDHFPSHRRASKSFSHVIEESERVDLVDAPTIRITMPKGKLHSPGGSGSGNAAVGEIRENKLTMSRGQMSTTTTQPTIQEHVIPLMDDDTSPKNSFDDDEQERAGAATAQGRRRGHSFSNVIEESHSVDLLDAPHISISVKLDGTTDEQQH